MIKAPFIPLSQLKPHIPCTIQVLHSHRITVKFIYASQPLTPKHQPLPSIFLQQQPNIPESSHITASTSRNRFSSTETPPPRSANLRRETERRASETHQSRAGEVARGGGACARGPTAFTCARGRPVKVNFREIGGRV